MQDEYLKGRGAQYNTKNQFLKLEVVQENVEGLDEPYLNDKVVSHFFLTMQRKL